MSRDTKQIQLPWLIQQHIISYIINDKRCGKRERNTLKIICSKYHRYIESCLDYEESTLDLRHMNIKTHTISNTYYPNITLRFHLGEGRYDRLFVWNDERELNLQWLCSREVLEYKEFLKLLSSKLKCLYFSIGEGGREQDATFSISQLIKLIEMAKDNIQLISIDVICDKWESQVEKALCDLVDYCVSDNLPNLVNFQLRSTKTVTERIINLNNNSSIKKLSFLPYHLESGSFTHIERLNLFKGIGIGYIKSLGGRFSNIKKLCIPSLYPWDGMMLQSFSKVTKLSVSNIYHSSLIQMLSQIPQLRILKYTYYTEYSLVIPSIKSVLQYLTVNTSLVELHGILYNEEVGKIIASNRKLRSLSMLVMDLSYIENINTMFNYLIQCHSLQYVQLHLGSKQMEQLRIGDYLPLNENTSDSFKLVDKGIINDRASISFIRVCNINK